MGWRRRPTGRSGGDCCGTWATSAEGFPAGAGEYSFLDPVGRKQEAPDVVLGELEGGPPATLALFVGPVDRLALKLPAPRDLHLAAPRLPADGKAHRVDVA